MLSTPQRRITGEGAEVWLLGGEVHRVDAPAVTRPDGTRYWCRDGRLHRLDGPAVTRPSGTEEWWVGGQRHRLDGPAYSRQDGAEQWWVDGERVPDEVAAVAWEQPTEADRARSLRLLAKARVRDADDARNLLVGVNAPGERESPGVAHLPHAGP